ncbi:hypothetical protein B7486_10635 [cyanobacterium TDX16]|nr:hypothetical protein B7486_10635 [cyanobacterium TDX16]
MLNVLGVGRDFALPWLVGVAVAKRQAALGLAWGAGVHRAVSRRASRGGQVGSRGGAEGIARGGDFLNGGRFFLCANG